MGISVSIINPSSISREGLRRIILDGGIEVVSTSASVDDLPELPDRSDHLVLVDMPSLADQLDSLQRLASRDTVSALILAEKFDLSSMLNCFDHGAQGYAVKDMPCDTLIALLRLAALGHKVIPPDVADMLRREDFRIAIPEARDDLTGLQNTGHGGGSKLSQRENDVLCCLMAGYSNKRIARKLFVTEATVKVHVKAILRKLNVANRTQAAMWATTHGVPTLDATMTVPSMGN
ncbi:response regulator transcription factor [Novosphingobium sp. 11B]|uniref:LuxR C-terminal-related transcriptional regulator n=1 Tax=Sphingomonas sp. LH128 TaxID=473781 RepID=UPI00027CC4E1|nr:response regulator transcription factor [Sphingomonas sp. LH128]EJU13674.1 two component LuxR family transcriptional regulator [Sphingomonas sp. LH128]